MSRPKRMLPVVGQVSPGSAAPREAPTEEPDACWGPGEDCCEGEAGLAAATPKTREANPETPEGVPLDGLERTVVRVEGMDCASCAATVERRVGSESARARSAAFWASPPLSSVWRISSARGASTHSKSHRSSMHSY